MDGDEPAGGRWNFDADNRAAAAESEARRGHGSTGTRGAGAVVAGRGRDRRARSARDLDRWERDGDVSFIGVDGPRRFPATRAEALAALEHFVDHRLPTFGPYEDAMLAGDPWMAHSLLSAPLNLGLLDPLEVVRRVESRLPAGRSCRIASAEGFVRQVIGWRDYIWNLYWHLGPDYRRRNALARPATDSRRGSPSWTPTPSRRGACRRCWPTCAITGGCTTSRG